MTDESGQTYPYTVDTLLDGALGSERYYGAFVANMHTDAYPEPEADAVFSSATSRGVPIISAQQLLTWVDARNRSAINSISGDTNTLNFSIHQDANAQGLQVMVPVTVGRNVTGVNLGGSPVSYTLRQVKGIPYAVLPGSNGNYQVSFGVGTNLPSIMTAVPTNGTTGVSQSTSVSVTFSEAMNAATITSSTFMLKDSLGNPVSATVTYNPSAFTAVLTPQTTLTPSVRYTVTVKGGAGGVTDVAGNPLASDFVITFTTADDTSYSIWSNSTLPSNPESGDTSSVEVGLKFQSYVDSYVTGIRFYKGAANTGTHVGSLWTSTGTLLGSVTFLNESDTGWQYQALTNAVAISSNTTYVVSYHAPQGDYAFDVGYFSVNGVTNYPLLALSSPEAGGNGVFAYGSSSLFPDQTYNGDNYWVDVVLWTGPAPTLTSLAVTPANLTVLPGATEQFTATGTYSDGIIQDLTSQVTWTSSNTAVAPIAAGGLATAVTGGATTISATEAGVTASTMLTVQAVATIWPSTTVPGTVDSGPDSPVELGVKFQSDVAGNIAGIRFYKAAANTGTHVGNLWTSTGTLLASVIFSGETDSGWQQMQFSSPVAITPNTVYVASYHCNNGHYSDDDGYFYDFGVDNYPLHALADGESGGNGVYVYGLTSAFPNQTYDSDNYWVDVMFLAEPATSSPVVTVSPATTNVECGSTVVLTANATGTGTLSYQWFDNQTNLLFGETGQTLTLNNVHLANAGNYTVVVTNPDGAATNFAVVIVGDTTPPVMSWSFTNLTLSADANCQARMPDVTGTNYILAADACSSVLTITQTPTNNAVLGLGTNEVVLAVADGNGNTAYSTNTVTVADQTAPVITVLGASPLTTECHAEFVDPGATALDNCSGVVSLSTNSTVNPNAVGVYRIEYVASDAAGNLATNTRQVYVVDTTAPVVSWNFTNLTLSADANCQALMPDVTGTNYILAADACSSVLTITQTPTNNAVLGMGTNEVVLAVADGSGNTAYSTNTVIVADQTAPVITVLGGNPLTTECHAEFVDPGATALDNCSGVVSLSTNSTVNPNTVGVYRIEYFASDAAGNLATNTRQVYVVDTTPPVVSWSFTNLTLSADANCQALMPDVTQTNYILAADACSSVLTITQTPTNNAVLGMGTNEVVLAVADGSGNTAYSTNTVIVADQTAPVITVLGDNPLTTECHAEFVDPGATALDNCSGVVSLSTNSTVNPNTVGVYRIEYVASDAAGNLATNTRQVYVVDTTPPVVSWSFTNLTLRADANCQALMPDVTGTNYILAADACSSVLTITQTPTNNAVLGLGTNEVVLAVADGSGNTAYSTNTVIVADQTAPVITVLGGNPLTTECHAEFVDPGATALDNCSGVVSLSTNSTVNPNTVGVYTIEYVASDAAGNLATNTRQVYVVDTTPPVITQCAPDQTVTAGYNGLATLSNLAILVVATDACSASVNIAQQPPAGTEVPVGPNTVVFYVDDGNGNTNTCTSTVTVNAASLVAPTILSGQVLGNGSFKLTFSGPNTQSYEVRASANLTNPPDSWDVLTNSAFGTGPATFIDTSATSHPMRFYRVVSP